MKKIRIGNDFVFNWAIERGGLPEDLSSVLEKHLHLSVFGKRVELIEGVDYDITGNVIRIEVTPAIANIIGTYKAEFHYILPDNGLIDDDRKCAVDVDAFQIVAKTAQADDSTEFSMTSDMAIAFKGDKGDSAYQVWLEEGNIGTEEDYFAYLRQPAIDAGASISELEGEIQVNEDLRIQAEDERVNAESSRQTAESLRVDAEILRQTNTQTAITNAEDATENANMAAQNADDAREAIQDDLALKANQTDLAQLESDVSTEFAKGGLIASYTHTSNKEVVVESIDFVTGIITATGHGLVNNDRVNVAVNQFTVIDYPTKVVPNGLNTGTVYFVVNTQPNTFMLSISSGGAPISISDKATKDYTKWHFEIVANVDIANLPNISKCKIIISGKSCNVKNPPSYVTFYKNNSIILGGASPVWTAQSYRYPNLSSVRLLTDIVEYANIMAYHEISIDLSLPRATICLNGIRVRGVTDTTNEVVKTTNDIFVHNTDGGLDFDKVNIGNVCNGMTIKIYR